MPDGTRCGDSQALGTEWLSQWLPSRQAAGPTMEDDTSEAAK